MEGNNHQPGSARLRWRNSSPATATGPHLTKGRWYATADLATVKGRNIFWFNPTVSAHRQKAARLPEQNKYL